MKKTVALVASATAVAFAAPVAAQNVNPVVHELTGEVDGVCTLADSTPQPVQIDFGTLSGVDVGSQTPEQANGLTIICNDPDGGTLSISSANNGVLRRDGTNGGANNEVGYSFRTTGTITIPTGNLATQVNRTFNASSAYINGQSITLRFAANGVRAPSPAGNGGTISTVFAGTYSDTVTVAVTAN
ncbi:hypothetical protein [Qipengyuania sp. JC766]|uniref:hypothetical protein n=1 Tax=Qipengyuania sp. JC766 TaxID=3232139 RepID=UPI0034598E00